MTKRTAVLLWLLLFAACAFAQRTEEERSWNQPVEPFKIIGNIYYVGASDVTSYLVTSKKGHILIDSGFPETVSKINANIDNLGFKLKDVKILLNSHAHYDHAGGLAELRRMTGAKLYVSRPDEILFTKGGLDDPNFGDRFPFEATKPDVLFDDNFIVRLGDASLTANITSGHTRGCTTWTTTAKEKGKTYNVAFICSTSSPDYKLVKNAAYPTIADDYVRTFERLKAMKVDVFLGAHGGMYNLQGKIEAMKKNGANPFIDPQGYRDYLTGSEIAFRTKLDTQKRQGN
jgi:metallo-beta-lactamase class B